MRVCNVPVFQPPTSKQNYYKCRRDGWFKEVFGFDETDSMGSRRGAKLDDRAKLGFENVRKKFKFENGYIEGLNKIKYYVGNFECPKISELRERLSIVRNSNHNSNQLIQQQQQSHNLNESNQTYINDNNNNNNAINDANNEKNAKNIDNNNN